MISSTLLIVAAVVVLVLVVALAALLVVRARSRPSSGALPAPGDPPAAGGYVCPFCKRPYAPAQTGNRCPACGAAAPRR